MSCVAIHLVELIRLTQAIPSSEICWVSIDSSSVTFDGGTGVFHLKVLVAHQSPGGYELFIKLDCSHEIESALLVVSTKTIVIPNNAARFRSIFVILEHCKR